MSPISLSTQPPSNTMNIFALHPNPRKCARWHVDKHVVKMILETCQLLYTAHWVLTFPTLRDYPSAVALSRFQKTLTPPESMSTAPPTKATNAVFRPVHVRHPCAKWARQTLGNYKWLALLGIELAREFRHRFGHEHSCEKHVEWLFKNPPPNILKFPRKSFSIAMDDQYKVADDPIRSYRNYYKTSKAERGLVHYTERNVPHWLVESSAPHTPCSK